MWLAVLDGLLFPLLALTGLIGWFWHWVFYDLIRAAITAGQPELSTLERLIVNNTTPFTALAALVSSLVAGIIIIPMVWRAVNSGSSAAPNQPSPGKNSTGKAIAIGCGVLLLVGIAVVGLGFVMPLVMRDRSKQAHDRFMAAHKQEFTEATARAEQIEEQLEKKLAEYDWEDPAAGSRPGHGVLETVDGRTCLKIENPNDGPLMTRLLTIEKPPINAMRYAVIAELRYENIQGTGYLEMWSEFPEGRYFSRTLGEPGTGPTSQLSGTSGWREFSLPFDRSGTTNAPTRIEVNLHLPGRGVVYVGPLKLIEIGQDTSAHDASGTPKSGRIDDSKLPADAVTRSAEAWLAKIDAGEYARSWEEAAVFFRNAITESAWSGLLTKSRKPLGTVKSRKLLNAQRAKNLPGAPDGEYVIMQFETSFAAKAQAVETVTFMKEADGSWQASGYFIR
jgi:hypothetical protein